LKGLYFFRKRSKEDLNRSLAYFEEAIAREPQYAPAYAGLANVYTALGSGFPMGLPFKEAHLRARDAAMKAVELDDARCGSTLIMSTLTSGTRIFSKIWIVWMKLFKK